MEVIQSPLEGIRPQDHIFGTQLRYSPSGEIESLVSATAGFGKVARLEQLTEEFDVPLDRVVYVGQKLGYSRDVASQPARRTRRCCFRAETCLTYREANGARDFPLPVIVP